MYRKWNMDITENNSTNKSPIEVKIGIEQMQMLYQSLPFNAVFHISASFILCAVLWTIVEREALLYWWLAVALIALIRMGTYLYYRVSEASKYSTGFWVNLYLSGALVAGASWGFAGVYLSPHDNFSYELFVGFIIAGMAMGAVPILSPVKSVYLSFSLSAALPYIVHVFTHEGTLYTAVGIIHCIFLVLMVIMALRMHKLIRESLLLRFYNIDLVEKLQTSNDMLVGEVDSHKETEEKLRENEQRLVALANAAFEGIVLHQDGMIVEANQGIKEMTGYSPDELDNKPVEILFTKTYRSTVVSHIHAPSNEYIEAEIIKKSGGCTPIEMRTGFAPYRGQHVAYIVMRDITHYKQLLKAQEIGRQKAEEADKSKTEFLAAVSHELRTPLNAVMGFTQLLQDTPLTDEQEEYLSMTYQSGEQLLSLINDLLDLSRIETGHFELEIIEFDLLAELQHVLKLISIKLAESGNMLRINFDENLPKEIKSDPLRLRQILLNLLGNAIKFTDNGEIEFTVTIEDKVLLFIVKDSGVGIAEDQQAYIFGKFNQIDSSVSRSHGGAGLGLAISKRLVETLGGEISVESKLNKGATFEIRLPLLESSGSDNDEVGYSESTEKKSEKQRAEGMNILLVEDDKTNQMIAITMLKKFGHTITVVEDGQQAVDLCLQENDFQLVFMDIQMPVMDGITATRKLRELGIVIPIVAMTANAMTGDREEYLKAGLDNYISKPIYKEKLLAIIQEYNSSD